MAGLSLIKDLHLVMALIPSFINIPEARIVNICRSAQSTVTSALPSLLQGWTTKIHACVKEPPLPRP